MASATVFDRYLNFEIPSTSDFFTRMWTGVLRCSCSCRCFRSCRRARGLQRDCRSRFWMEPGRCISSDGQQFVNVRTQWLIEICRVCIVILQYWKGFAWVYTVYSTSIHDTDISMSQMLHVDIPPPLKILCPRIVMHQLYVRRGVCGDGHGSSEATFGTRSTTARCADGVALCGSQGKGWMGWIVVVLYGVPLSCFGQVRFILYEKCP